MMKHEESDEDETRKRRNRRVKRPRRSLRRTKPKRLQRGQSHLDAVQAARRWAREAIIKTKAYRPATKRETDTEYDKRIEEAVDELIDRVVAPGEFYLVRAGNTRKGTGTSTPVRSLPCRPSTARWNRSATTKTTRSAHSEDSRTRFSL